MLGFTFKCSNYVIGTFTIIQYKTSFSSTISSYFSSYLLMPRKYNPTKEQVDRQKIQQCLETMASEGLSRRAAATRFGISETTLRRHDHASASGKVLPPIGRLPSIPLDMQIELAIIAKTAARHGFGLLKEEVTKLVGDYVQANRNNNDGMGTYLRAHCRFVNGVPSEDWVTEFMRNHNLSLKKPTPLERCRMETTSDPFIIYEFYDLVKSEMSRLHIEKSPEKIWNLDETAFFTDPRTRLVVGGKGESTHRTTAGSGHSCFTAMACVSADGTSLPPLIIFTAKNLYSSCKGQTALPGTTYGCSGNK
jgi:hypothetical protein